MLSAPIATLSSKAPKPSVPLEMPSDLRAWKFDYENMGDVRVCQWCGNEARYRCPTCVAQDLYPYFCSKQCLHDAWRNKHQLVHKCAGTNCHEKATSNFPCTDCSGLPIMMRYFCSRACTIHPSPAHVVAHETARELRTKMSAICHPQTNDGYIWSYRETSTSELLGRTVSHVRSEALNNMHLSVGTTRYALYPIIMGTRAQFLMCDMLFFDAMLCIHKGICVSLNLGGNMTGTIALLSQCGYFHNHCGNNALSIYYLRMAIKLTVGDSCKILLQRASILKRLIAMCMSSNQLSLYRDGQKYNDEMLQIYSKLNDPPKSAYCAMLVECEIQDAIFKLFLQKAETDSDILDIHIGYPVIDRVVRGIRRLAEFADDKTYQRVLIYRTRLADMMYSVGRTNEAISVLASVKYDLEKIQGANVFSIFYLVVCSKLGSIMAHSNLDHINEALMLLHIVLKNRRDLSKDNSVIASLDIYYTLMLVAIYKLDHNSLDNILQSLPDFLYLKEFMNTIPEDSMNNDGLYIAVFLNIRKILNFPTCENYNVIAEIFVKAHHTKSLLETAVLKILAQKMIK